MFKILIFNSIFLFLINNLSASEEMPPPDYLLKIDLYQKVGGEYLPYKRGASYRFSFMINFNLMINEVFLEKNYSWMIIYISDKTPKKMLTTIIPLLKSNNHKVKIIKVDNLDKLTEQQWFKIKKKGIVYISTKESLEQGGKWIRANKTPPLIPIGKILLQWGTDSNFDFVSKKDNR